MIVNQSEQEEKCYLKQIINTIKSSLHQTKASVKDHVNTLQEYKEYLWNNKDIDPHEIRSMRESILNHFAIGETVIDKNRRLEKILASPYFGRIDFKEKAEKSKVNPIYIGVNSFYDYQQKKNLIYDWRAPVSGMFYDYEPGEASYISPSKKIQGEILLKRQYRIRKGKMEYMLESSLTIHDEILQKELSCNTEVKMKNIVATIQREQNRIIRNKEAQTLIIQGVAGSGKTSIALHRMAYLLYTFKESITSKDILILSPNKVFANYISNVLPELGEENIPETSMEQILSEVLENKYPYHTFFEQVSELINQTTPELTRRIQYKTSPDFPSQLERFILHVENNYFKPTDVIFNKYLTIPAEFIGTQFHRFHRYPMRKRFEAMTEYILDRMKVKYHLPATTAERNSLLKKITKMFKGNNDLQLYKDFFTWIGKPELFKLRKGRILEYADLAPLAYIHLAMEGNKKNCYNIKHLLIDEMQDYSPIQYKVIQKLYPCRKTILGDMNQSVNPYNSSTADVICKAVVTGEVMKLCKSYRSTYEITSFAKKIKFNPDLEPILRHGESPHILSFKTPEEEISAIHSLLDTFRISTYQSLGIICKSEIKAKELVKKLECYPGKVTFLSHKSFTFSKGIMVTSAHMAKGLEFDEVIIPQTDATNYKSEIDRNMLYIAATRAMHKLTLTHSGKINKWIE